MPRSNIKFYISCFAGRNFGQFHDSRPRLVIVVNLAAACLSMAWLGIKAGNALRPAQPIVRK